jgi:hypothetical protein
MKSALRNDRPLFIDRSRATGSVSKEIIRSKRICSPNVARIAVNVAAHTARPASAGLRFHAALERTPTVGRQPAKTGFPNRFAILWNGQLASRVALKPEPAPKEFTCNEETSEMS